MELQFALGINRNGSALTEQQIYRFRTPNRFLKTSSANDDLAKNETSKQDLRLSRENVANLVVTSRSNAALQLLKGTTAKVSSV